jgi:hypothetical protein
MRYARNDGGAQTRRGYQQSFSRVQKVFADCQALQPVSACRFDGQPSRKLFGTPHDYVLDVEKATQSVLDTPELREEWIRLLEEEINSPDAGEVVDRKPPRSAGQRALTDRVVTLSARVFQKRKLDRIGDYFRLVRYRVEE